MPKLNPVHVGQVFGRWKILSLDIPKYKHHVLCQCSCGTEPKLRCKYTLTRGKSQSCGCLGHEHLAKKNRTHGLSDTKAHAAWRAMICRCTNPLDKSYSNYGGRGITVCAEWQTFENFYTDMGECPKYHELDRVDPNGNYCKLNCEWNDHVDACRNRRSTKIFRGKRMFMYEIAPIFNMSTSTLYLLTVKYPDLSMDEIYKLCQ